MTSEEEKKTEEENQRKIAALSAKVPNIKCPMCGHSEFVMGEKHFAHVLQDAPGIVKISGRTVPTAYIVCKNCGFVSQHALGTLGLMDLTKAHTQQDSTGSLPPPPTAEG